MAILDRFRRDKAVMDNDETQPIAEASFVPSGDGYLDAVILPVGPEQARKAQETLARYKQGKANLDKRVKESEEWWKLRQWRTEPRVGKSGTVSDPMYAGAQLWNCITSKHADAMDSYPEPNVRPRMPDDKAEAEKLTDVLPVILERNNFMEVYSDHWWSLLKKGTGVYGVFWDGQVMNGLGDIAIRNMDLLNLAWEPGVTDIQASRNVFYETLVDNETLKAAHPEIADRIGQKKGVVQHYRYDDNVDTTDKSAVVDWYYKKNGVIHYAQLLGDDVLFATENEPENYPNGLYDHGMYPFVVQALFPVEGTIAGNGYYDVARQTQEQIDVLNQAIVKNAAFGAKPRFFIREDGTISEEEFADPERDFVHVNGNLGEDSIRQILVTPFPANALSLLEQKIDELKEVTGNRDVANGGTTSGVTAASAIAAMQEASGKMSRDANLMAYDAYRRMILMVIELIRQFYNLPRWFLIRGQKEEEFIQLDNKGLVPQPQPGGGYRLPVFDVKVNAQKATPYTKMAQNELALQLLQAGFFTPGNERVALACLEMMDFDDKDEVVSIIERNDAVMQAAKLAFILMQQDPGQVLPAMQALGIPPEIIPQLAQTFGQAQQAPQPGQGGARMPEVTREGTPGGESSVTAKARAQAAEASRPR